MPVKPRPSAIYTLTESRSRDLVIEAKVARAGTRQPYTAAVAIKVGADTLVFDAERERVTVNGQRRLLATREGFDVAGARVARGRTNDVTVTTAAGDTLSLALEGGRVTRYEARFAAARPAGSLNGLMGGRLSDPAEDGGRDRSGASASSFSALVEAWLVPLRSALFRN